MQSTIMSLFIKPGTKWTFAETALWCWSFAASVFGSKTLRTETLYGLCESFRARTYPSPPLFPLPVRIKIPAGLPFVFLCIIFYNIV